MLFNCYLCFLKVNFYCIRHGAVIVLAFHQGFIGTRWQDIVTMSQLVAKSSMRFFIGIDEKCDYAKKAVEMKQIYISSFNATIKSETELSLFLKHKNGEIPAFGNW